MAINSEVSELTFYNVVAGTPISVGIIIQDVDTVEVLLGAGEDTADAGFDYSLEYDDETRHFTMTPTAAMLLKLELDGTNVVRVRRTLPYTTMFQSTDSFIRENIRDEFDRTVMRDQQLSRLAGATDTALTALSARAVRVPLGETIDVLPASASRAAKLFGFDGAGDPVAVALPSDGGPIEATDIVDSTAVGRSLLTAATMEDVRALIGAANILTADMAGGASLLAPTGYGLNATIITRRGETVALSCNPTTGDDFQDMAYYMAGQSLAQQNGYVSLNLANGLHSLETYLAFTDMSRLHIQHASLPTYYDIDTAVINTTADPDVYEITLTFASALDARAVVGFGIGIQNCYGSPEARALNGAASIKWISGDLKTIKYDKHLFGNFTTGLLAVFNRTTIFGMTAAKLLLPYATLRVNPDGWDGSGVEGFLNPMDSSRIKLSNFALIFDGPAGTEHDLIFGTTNSFLNTNFMIMAGAGDKVIRLAANAYFRAYGSCIGGDGKAIEAVAAQAQAGYMVQRCSVGGVETSLFTVINHTFAMVDQCRCSGASYGMRATYESAFGTVTTSAISHCNFGAGGTKGSVDIGAVEIADCGYDYSVAGPIDIVTSSTTTYVNNTNTTARNRYINGGHIRVTGTDEYAIGEIAPDAVLYDFGNVPANNHLDSTEFPLTGLEFGDFLQCTRSTATVVAHTIRYEAYVSSAGNFKIRAINYGTADIDPANATYVVKATKS